MDSGRRERGFAIDAMRLGANHFARLRAVGDAEKRRNRKRTAGAALRRTGLEESHVAESAALVARMRADCIELTLERAAVGAHQTEPRAFAHRIGIDRTEAAPLGGVPLVQHVALRAANRGRGGSGTARRLG